MKPRSGPCAAALAALGFFFQAAHAADPTHVYVVNTLDASISLVELAGMTEIRRVPVGPRPYGIALTGDGKLVAVGVEDEEKVKFLDTTTFEARGETPIGKMHNDHIVLSADGKHILVANFYSDDVVGIDAATMKEAFRIKETSAPHVIKYGPQRRNAYVTCKKITGIAIVDPAARKLVKFHQLNVNPRSLTFSPDETKLYFGSFWVDGFFEMETESGKVTRLFAFDPPQDNRAPQEVTYHGVEAVGGNLVLAANEGRSYVDAVDVSTGKLANRLTGMSKPCCVEKIPGPAGGPVSVLVSCIGDGTLARVDVGTDGKMTVRGRARVGAAPKRVAFAAGSAAPGRAERPKESSMRETWGFESDQPGKAARGITGAVGEWIVVEDPSAPSGHRVLRQTARNSKPTFNVALVDAANCRDLELSVRLRAVSGEIDQGGGVVWRASDAQNYYIARYNPLEENFRVYVVREGQRTQLGSADIPRKDEWHAIRVIMKGEHIECYFNDRKYLDADDATFRDASRIGLWTKADAVTSFDDLRVAPLVATR